MPIDAGEKQLTGDAAKLWLDDLRELAYDAEDILGELATEALGLQTDKRKLEQQVTWLCPKLLGPETEDKNRAHLLEFWSLSVHVLINSGGIKIQNFVKSVNC